MKALCNVRSLVKPHSVEEESDETKTVYRIYYTNGTYSEFVVNHGKDGDNGQDGVDGKMV